MDNVIAGYMPYDDHDGLNRTIHRIIRLAYASGLSFTSYSLKRLILIGDGDCLGCGSNDISYGNDWAVCSCCGHNWPVTVPLYSYEW
ncbi:MAG: hypothetical protein ABFD04_00400 [Syntrophomonas sp.]